MIFSDQVIFDQHHFFFFGDSDFFERDFLFERDLFLNFKNQNILFLFQLSHGYLSISLFFRCSSQKTMKRSLPLEEVEAQEEPQTQKKVNCFICFSHICFFLGLLNNSIYTMSIHCVRKL